MSSQETYAIVPITRKDYKRQTQAMKSKRMWNFNRNPFQTQDMRRMEF